MPSSDTAEEGQLEHQASHDDNVYQNSIHPFKSDSMFPFQSCKKGVIFTIQCACQPITCLKQDYCDFQWIEGLSGK